MDDVFDDAPFIGPVRAIDPDRVTYTVIQAAYLLNLTVGVTLRYMQEGIIPGERIRGCWVVPRTRFHAWLDALPDARAEPSEGKGF